MPLKIMTIVGTRPEIIKLSRIIHELESHSSHILVHTGQNFDYELNQIFFDQLKINRPHYFLNAAGKNAAETMALVISKSDEILEKENPDALLVYGDTNSCLSVIAAKRRKIPIFHMEAGNRCFDQRVPEEINRKIVDHLSDINFVHSEHARQYLIREGLPPETIIKSGSPMKEILSHYKNDIEKSEILDNLNLRPLDYFVVSLHREENVDSSANLQALLDTINEIAKKYKKRIIFSTHPRTRKRLESIGVHFMDPMIEFMKPLGFFDYIKLQKKALCVLSDSGTITEESSLMQFPAVMVREAHERPEGMDVGTVIMTGLKKESILDCINITIKQWQDNPEPLRIISDYNTMNVSQQVMKVIRSYTDYVNRTVWKK